MTLGQRLRELRVSGDDYWRMREVATAAGVDFSRWSRIEAGYERPAIPELERAALFLRADLDELIPLWGAFKPAPTPDLNAPGVFVCRRGGGR